MLGAFSTSPRNLRLWVNLTRAKTLAYRDNRRNPKPRSMRQREIIVTGPNTSSYRMRLGSTGVEIVKNIPENNTPADETLGALAHSINEAANRFQSLALESVRRAVEIQFEVIGKAFDTYISQMSKLGRAPFAMSPTFGGRRHEQSDTPQRTREAQAQLPSVEESLDRGRRVVAQSLTTKRKTGTVAKSESASQRSRKGKTRRGSPRRTKK